LALTLVLVPTANAQLSTASITGTVKDPSGGVKLGLGGNNLLDLLQHIVNGPFEFQPQGCRTISPTQIGAFSKP
jgi:hypothetical protein